MQTCERCEQNVALEDDFLCEDCLRLMYDLMEEEVWNDEDEDYEW